ncbi:N2227-like protein-domain-containing protein [Verticillium dahliae]|nr:N2227-like protein-domain-containing protein [Verticillium dahliae]
MAAAEDGSWDQTGEMFEDPEEKKVVYCALDSYLQYAKVAHFNVTHLRRQSFYALPQAQWQMLAAPPFNFLDTPRPHRRSHRRQRTTGPCHSHHGIKSLASPILTLLPRPRPTSRPSPRPVFTAVESQPRAPCHHKQQQQWQRQRRKSQRPRPRAGLGRLVFELAAPASPRLGLILNHTKTAGQFTIFPGFTPSSNHRTRENHLRSYAVPDLHPGTALASVSSLSSPPSQPGTMSMCAADFLCLYGDEARRATYDVVATVFFLDTAPNLVRYLETILSCLKPGGIPRQQQRARQTTARDDDGDGEHDYNNSSGIADPGSFELADDEVMALVERVGFVVEARETDRPAPYIQDDESMMQTLYRASTWVARKPLAGDGI